MVNNDAGLQPSPPVRAAHVFGGVWISGDDVPRDAAWMTTANIDLVVDCRAVFAPAAWLWAPDHAAAMPTVIRAGVSDTHQLDVAAAEIARGLAARRSVLVHCVSGINRAALVVAWYFITRRNMSYEQAVSYVAKANEVRGVSTLTEPDFRERLAARDV